MYINEVISYLGAWENFKNNHYNLLEDLQTSLDSVRHELHKEYENNNSKVRLFGLMRDLLITNLESLDWDRNDYLSPSLGPLVNPSLGLKKDSCYVRIATASSSSILMSWIYSEIQSANKIGGISIPIMLVLDFSEKEFVDNLNSDFNESKARRKNLKFINKKLERITPLKFEYPFLILGVGVNESAIKLTEVEKEIQNINDSNIKLDRCITFEPEYYQAGLSILSYFGTVLRDKYPEQNATVRIEQHDLTVRMVIHSEDGNIETIEKALSEYELVLKGETSPDEFAISPLKALELKNQLNLVKFQVESQREIIALQNGQILDLKQIVDKALSPNSHPPVTIINQLHNSQSIVINHKAEISKSNDDLEELIDLADSDGLKNKLAMIQNALDINRNSDNPEDVKDSNGMKKLAKFLKEANEVGTEANSLADKGGKALELIKSLGRSYNSIAQWCGMPVIPNVFVKE
ncbi:hypothetical protein [Acinetobacter venetianus]|uniref:hypothetical protein n=1 Tax=Acinetobacter venetianus TaxID=52133 RepID=UPI0010233135|nr:hypothetical protein [Acinetobacter venetianus]RZG79124.1 hypothetical protein EXE23_14480 [Acinetobacter venetianus]